MRDHPILIPTSRGPVGAIVSEPEGEPRAALVLFQGGGPPARCGVNAVWTRIARGLAEAGIVVLRFDFACEADSVLVGMGMAREPAWRSSIDLPLTREVSAWFRERAGMEILVAGSCYGARLALEVAAEDQRIEGVFLATPYLAGVRRKKAAPGAVQAATAQAELPNPPEGKNDRLGAVAVDSSRAVLQRDCPLWILVGDRDGPHAEELADRIGEGTRLEIEVAAGIALHPGTDPAAQQLLTSRMVERICGALQPPGNGSRRSLSRLPPGPDLPQARQSRRWIGRPLSFLRELQAEHGDLFTLHLQYQDPWVVVGDPEHVKRVLTAPADVLHSGEANEHLVPILGLNSLLTLDGDAHMRHRKLLLPPFHGARMSRYGEIMRDATQRELERWPRDEPSRAAPRMSALTLEVILRAVFGAQQREQLEPLRDAMTGVVEAAAGARLALLGRAERLRESRFAEFRRVLSVARERLQAEISRHRADPRLGEREDVMSLLLQARYEDGSEMTDAELRDELTTLLLAGHETTAMSLAWTLERLARHPEALARVSAEADAGGGPYTEAAIRETLRVRPVFAVVARLVKEPFELGGYEIPPGVTIMPSPVLVHHRPSLYPEPDEFLPERFLDQQPGTYTWIPFGGGVRRCIGANFALFEMGVVLSTLLAQVRPRAVNADAESPRRRLITLGPARGAEVVLEAR